MRFAPFFLMLPGLALAQTNDLEYRETNLEEDAPAKLQAQGLFETQWHEFNNLDFRELDESSDQAILDSDDRNSLAFTGVGLNLSYDVDDRVRFVLGASHRGLWGTDQFGGTNVFGGWVYFNAAHLDIKAGSLDNPVVFRVGRQFYKIGGMGNFDDYTLADVLDMVRIDIPLGTVGKLTVVPINVVSQAQTADGANFSRFIGQSTVETFGFRGDRTTRRFGGTLDLDNLGPAQVVAYGFYSDLGALGTGSDISYDGLLGNFTDNDWVANVGLRGNVKVWEDQLTIFAGIDGSLGIDRKELVARDVDTNGYALTAGATLRMIDEDTNDGMMLEASIYHTLGATHGEDGLLSSHGYVGMKGQQAGGLIANRYMGWHPAAYVDLFGVDDSPHDIDRKAGTQVINASLSYERGAVYGNLGWWMMRDTSISFLPPANLNSITPPFGYSREEFAAQQRLGRLLGNEINFSLGAHATNRVDIYGQLGVLIPGGSSDNPSFYRIVSARVAGDQLGSTDPQMPVAAMGGLRVRL